MQIMHRLKHGLLQAAGWLFYLTLLMGLASLLPTSTFDAESKDFIFLIGAVGIWRYSMGATHFVRGMIFLYIVYPHLRRKLRKLGKAADPSHVFLMVTSFRIDAHTTAQVYQSVIREAIDCGFPTTAISRHLPDSRAVVAVIDGDTVLSEGVVRRTVPWFHLFDNVGGLTTNEFCEVRGGYVMSEWHKLRFAQRHINMCSMALSKRVLTMTGRMSVFRAEVVTDPGFIADVENDSLEHWRLGRFKFLTGDDKSSWYSLMRLGYDTFYVPDAAIHTVEHPPEKSFIKSSRKLMYRWYGNNLRQNSRALGLGIRRLGLFTSVVLFDQRVSMWTSLLGLTVALIASFKYGIEFVLAYLLWIGITRLILTILLACSGHSIGPAYPVILYYNQIVGALMKIYVFFRLDRQSWTRQDTKLSRDLASFQGWFNTWSSRTMTFSAGSIFIAVLMTMV